ncbi:type I methionyl aminopeptidase [Candidatus Beckwithbacteria bacterium]|nr:type I methionyl aminopeptidase [Candidatus Beckwithbacteria bacterium]
MKIDLKKPEQIEKMKTGGEKLASILFALIAEVKIGDKLIEIEKKAWEGIEKQGGKPGFSLVDGYHWATCININEGIVHGIPTERVLEAGDIVSIDIGMFYKGFHTDMSYTFKLPGENKLEKNEQEITHFLAVGKQALEESLQQIRPGQRIGHISQKMQTIIEGNGYSCMRNLTGHGIGRKLHEYPPVPCFLNMPIEETLVLREGMTLAIEVLYAQGGWQNKTDEKDGWTIRTADGKISAVFEKTIAVSGDGCLILTPHLIKN